VQIPYLNRKHILTGIVVFLMGFFVVFVSRYGRIHNPHAVHVDSTRTVYIWSKTDLTGLDEASQLAGITYNKRRMHWVARMLGWVSFQPGRYEFDKSQSFPHFLRRFALGIQSPIRVTILPGQTEEGFARRVSSQFRFNGSRLWDLMHDTTALANLGTNPTDLIGRMLPDTYQFYWTETPQQVLQKILDVFQKKAVEPYQQQYQKMGKSVNQILTIASIVEWEAGDNAEKPTIAGLYWNRLKKGWKLQADPTINYAKGVRSRLLFDDYYIKSPYNTYLHRGLPPGPITNPSLSSIRAALFPEKNDYMFMVATPEGVHVFSKTFAQHKRRSAQWRRWLHKQYRLKREREEARTDSLRKLQTAN